ncbi:aminoglycoside phosphotransferase family protein [Streptomyces sp. NPDC007025]|uniref:aminoglycoside phosphotransferase family protein n=1 Tax=Streptomyces sp. NPDC007025 TaxID=3364771 RepID=UPI0036B4E4EC
MCSLPSSGRLSWTTTPAELRTAIENELGAPVTDAVTPPGGFGHQLAAALTLTDGRRAFVKAAPEGDSLTTANLHEATALQHLPPHAPAPALLGTTQAAGWLAVLFEHLEGAHPDLRPGRDAGEVWALLDKLASSPASSGYLTALPATGDSPTARLHGWTVLDRVSLPQEAILLLPRLRELEAAWPALARGGDRIVHGDLRADNMVATHRRGVVFVDWAHATHGPAAVDAVSLAPQLVLAGHHPRDTARTLTSHHALAPDPAPGLAFLAALTGHWQRNATLPAPPGAPGLRPYQQRAAAAGLSLLHHLLQEEHGDLTP